MRVPTYVYRSRHGIYFFRIVVPGELRGALSGQREVKRSLHTRDKRQALVLARQLALDIYPLFVRVDAMKKQLTPPTVADVLANAEKLRKLTITGSEAKADGTLTPYQIKTDSDSPQELATARAVAGDLERMHLAFRAAKDKPTPERIATMERERAELTAILLSPAGAEPQLSAGSPQQSEPSPMAPERATATYNDAAHHIGVLWPQFAEQKQGADWRAPRTFKANERMFNTFLAWAGDRDIRTINKVLISKFKDYLRTKARLQGGKRKGQLGLDGRTVDNHTLVLNKFMIWAQDGGYFHEGHVLPTANQIIVSKRARRMRAEKSNPPYTIAQLQQIFEPKVFHPKLAHHFWPPLIALYTGARRREIAQLLFADFFVRTGVNAMSINMDGDSSQSLKSAAAKRVIPVHPALIELGLLDYLDDVKALGLSSEVFPGIGANVNGEKGNAVGSSWGRHLRRVGISQSTLHTYHSFRSTAISVLKAANVPIDMRCQLVGHEFDHVSEGYSNKYTVKDLYDQAIPKLAYEGLDLTPLRYTPKQFDATNRSTYRLRVHDEDKRKKEAEAKAAAEQKAARASSARANKPS